MICLACGDQLTPGLDWAGSVRCHDCRDDEAPLRSDLLARQLVRHPLAAVLAGPAGPTGEAALAA